MYLMVIPLMVLNSSCRIIRIRVELILYKRISLCSIVSNSSRNPLIKVILV